MNLQATFTNPSGQAKTLDIKDGFSLQDAYNVVANDDFAPTQIILEAINMNSSDSNLEPEKQVETAYDLIGRHSSNDIIDKHKISSDELAALLEEGTNHELEHTSNYLIAMKIAQDHLYEDLRYYSKLKEVMLARGAAIESAKFKNGELENQKIIDVAKSVVLELGEIYSENDYLGKCKEISEEISNRLNNLNINAIPMRIIEGEDTKYNSLVFNHAYTFLPDKNYIVDTQLWQLESNIDDLSQRKVLFSFDEYNKIVKLYDVEPIDNWEERFRQGAAVEMSKKEPKIKFDKGGYVSEEVLIENNIDKIDDIYVFSEDDKPVKSLGQFTFKGFGKYVMQDLAGELYDDYKIRLRSDFAIMLQDDVIKPSIKVAQMKGDKIELLAIIYNALVSDEQSVSYVYNEDGEVVGKFTDEDFAEDMVNNNDGYYSEVRVEELETPETILAMQFDFNKHQMTFISTLLEKKSTHKFKYGGKL